MPGPIHTQHWEAPPGRWSFSASEPAAALTGLVTQYWEVRGELAPFSERVLPNGALEVMVNLGPIHHLVDGDVRTRWDHAWLSGLHERAIAIESADGTHLVSARLTPLGASTLLGPAAAAAANRVVALTEVLGQAANPLVDALRAAPDAATRFQLLEECLLGFLPPAVPVPPFVVAALERLEAEHGRLRITELHAGLGVSRKHLTVPASHRRWAFGPSAMPPSAGLRGRWPGSRPARAWTGPASPPRRDTPTRRTWSGTSAGWPPRAPPSSCASAAPTAPPFSTRPGSKSSSAPGRRR